MGEGNGDLGVRKVNLILKVERVGVDDHQVKVRDRLGERREGLGKGWEGRPWDCLKREG